MEKATPLSISAATPKRSDHDSADLLHVVEPTAHLMPEHGQIEAFVDHNAVHASEKLPFDRTVPAAFEIYSAESYLSEQRYRQIFSEQRIDEFNLRYFLNENLDYEEHVPTAELESCYASQLAMPLHAIRMAQEAELRWVIAETEGLTLFGDAINSVRIDEIFKSPKESLETGRYSEELQARFKSLGRGKPTGWGQDDRDVVTLFSLWEACDAGVELSGRTVSHLDRLVRLQDVLLAATGEDTGRFAHEMETRFTAMFIDQGFANWNLLQRDDRYFIAFVALFSRKLIAGERWGKGLSCEVQKTQGAQTMPIASIRVSLQLMGVKSQDQESFITRTLFSLPDWRGMVSQLDDAPNWNDRRLPKDTLVEFLAVCFLFDWLNAIHAVAERIGFSRSLDQLSDHAWDRVEMSQETHLQRRFVVSQSAERLKLTRKEYAAVGQGLGNPRRHATKCLTENDSRLTGFSDASGGLFNRSRRDVAALLQRVAVHKVLERFLGVGERSNLALRELDCEMDSPYAMQNRISEDAIQDVGRGCERSHDFWKSTRYLRKNRRFRSAGHSGKSR